MRGPVLYPIVVIIHVLGFVLLVGAVTMFDLRVLGFTRQLPLKQLSRLLLPWSLLGFLMIAPTGLMMFIAHPDQYIDSRIFLLKLTLIAIAGLNAAMFHVGVFQSVASWNVEVEAPLQAKVHAVLSILVWVAVICCGRLLSFV
ncbi:MAG: DUF6644 family protein [Janthinobacterium lividum]